MPYRYYTVDVFTNTRFGGNPLAVFPNAEGLSDTDMQRIAREFNYSETTFVLGPEDPSHDARVRIFMPNQEVPFAGHPNVGTAFVLATVGALGVLDDGERVVRFKELAGVVPVRVHSRDGQPTFCELTAPQALELGPALPPSGLAEALGISARDVLTQIHSPLVVSAGLPAAMVEVRAEALARTSPSTQSWSNYTDAVSAVVVYARGQSARTLSCRMFAPGLGIPEDPATGSAVCALAGLLAHHDPEPEGDLVYLVRQGEAMGRPSELTARVTKQGGEVGALRVGGACVAVMEGTLTLG